MTDPLALLTHDRTAAHESGDPWANLCVLTTIADDGAPEARVLVLRDIDGALGVFVNATSPKARELDNSREATVLTYLSSIGVQYRLRARLEPMPPHIVRDSWHLRPDIPKVMDWVYATRAPQSSPVASRDALMTLFDEVGGELPDPPVAPEQAQGLYIVPTRIDRLQLAGDRVHDRHLYRHTPHGWDEQVLIP